MEVKITNADLVKMVREHISHMGINLTNKTITLKLKAARKSDANEVLVHIADKETIEEPVVEEVLEEISKPKKSLFGE